MRQNCRYFIELVAIHLAALQRLSQLLLLFITSLICINVNCDKNFSWKCVFFFVICSKCCGSARLYLHPSIYAIGIDMNEIECKGFHEVHCSMPTYVLWLLLFCQRWLDKVTSNMKYSLNFECALRWIWTQDFICPSMFCHFHFHIFKCKERKKRLFHVPTFDIRKKIYLFLDHESWCQPPSLNLVHFIAYDDDTMITFSFYICFQFFSFDSFSYLIFQFVPMLNKNLISRWLSWRIQTFRNSEYPRICTSHCQPFG